MGNALRALRSLWSKYWIVVFIVAGGSAYFFTRTFVIEPWRVPSQSMEPSLTLGSFFLAVKWGYGNYRFVGFDVARRPPSRQVRRGDVLLLRLPTDDQTTYVKRVVGLPGERIDYVGGELRIEGRLVPRRLISDSGGVAVYEERLDDAAHRIQHFHAAPARDFSGTVPAGHYFMLGDNRDNSRDSRFGEVGYISESLLVGKVAWVVVRMEPQAY